MLSQRWPLAKTWTRWTKQAGLGVAGASDLVPSVGAVRVPDAEGDLDGLGFDEGRAAGQRLWGRRSSASWGSTARHAVPSRSWCCLFSGLRR